VCEKLTAIANPVEKSMMKIRKTSGIVIVLLLLLRSFTSIAQGAVEPAQLRQRLMASMGTLPTNLKAGYRLDGQFTLKATGEEIPYDIQYLRASTGWVADFTQENHSLNLRFFSSGKQTWISSPEITAETEPWRMPYMVQFDPHQLYDALLQILKKGSKDPAFTLKTTANEIYVRGTLANGWGAVFVFNTIDFFPRKVRINTASNPSAAWMIPVARPDGTCSSLNIPRSSSEFEIWMSDPTTTNGYRYAQRLDFVEYGIVLGTFIIKESTSIAGSEQLFNRPPSYPWLESARFNPREDSFHPSIYLDDTELATLRDRITQKPWADWNRESLWITSGSVAALWMGRLFPHSLSPRLLRLSILIAFMGYLFLLLRRHRQLPLRKFPWRMLIGGIVVAGLVFIAGMASYFISRPQDRSRMALHTSIRYAATGQSIYASSTDALLNGITRRTLPKSMEELSQSCQEYSLAYDLIRKNLLPKRRLQIEEDLFNYAKPLFGAAQGWTSNSRSGPLIASGLGMTGLAIGCDSYVDIARTVLDRALTDQFSDGLYRAGPGEGIRIMDSAENFFYGLKHTGRADYYSRADVQKYVQTSLQLLSPVGTVPLFGDTDLEHSRELSLLFLKMAAQMPKEMARQCAAAHDRFWSHGRFYSEGWRKWILPLIQPTQAYFENPYVFLQYTQSIQPADLPAFSALLGNKQSAVLRSGSDPDALYLALNLLQSSAYDDHRGLLSFDLYGYQSLLAHGPGSPGKTDTQYEETLQTASTNSITLRKESQRDIQGAGTMASLLNQPRFDYIRILADQTYDYGQVQRDVVLIRPEKNHPVYVFLLDDVFVTNPNTTVQWHLHGRGEIATGVGLTSRWTSASFEPPRLRPKSVLLEASHPIGITGTLNSSPGTLYSRYSSLNQRSQESVMEWTGSGRTGSLLIPRHSGGIAPKLEVLNPTSCRVGNTDWISLGSIMNRVTTGPLIHVSEYSFVRDRAKLFPALLMVSGVECRFGVHSIFSDKPMTASLNGLEGGFLNSRPDVHVEIISPEIQADNIFRLDGQSIRAEKPGLLTFTLKNPGEHSLKRVSDLGAVNK
jgi:hypothetical protein